MLRLFVRNNDHLEDRRLRPGRRAGEARRRGLVRPLQPDARGGPFRRGEPRHRYPDARGDEGHRAVGPALQGGRRRVHDHDGDDQSRHRSAGEEPDHLRAQGEHPGHGALFRPEAVQAVSGARQPSRAACRSAAARRSCSASSRPSSTGWRKCWKTPATRSTESRTRCSAARSGDKREPPGPAVGDRADRPQGRAADDGAREPAQHPAADQLPPGRRRGQEGDGRAAGRRRRRCSATPRRSPTTPPICRTRSTSCSTPRSASSISSRTRSSRSSRWPRSPSCRRRWSPRSTA